MRQPGFGAGETAAQAAVRAGVMWAVAAATRVRERRIADLVNEAYGLAPVEVQLMRETALP